MENKVRHFQRDYIEDDAMLEYRKRKTPFAVKKHLLLLITVKGVFLKKN